MAGEGVQVTSMVHFKGSKRYTDIKEKQLGNKARSIYRAGQKTKKTDTECFRLQCFFMHLQYNKVQVLEGKII